MSLKIAVVLQQGDKSTRKPWRFNPSEITAYRLADVEEDIIQLFPEVAKRDSRLVFHYKDSLVGNVELESDRDLREALQSFTEESDIQYKTFFVTAKRKPMYISTPSAASSNPMLSPKPKKRRLLDSTIPKEKIESILANVEKELGLPSNEQPLYIDGDDDLIKCRWCGKNFLGSQQTRCINQHVRKSASHRMARKKYLPNNRHGVAEDQNSLGTSDGGDQPGHDYIQMDHDYIQIYMHPRPEDCNQSTDVEELGSTTSVAELESDQNGSDQPSYTHGIVEVYLNSQTDVTTECQGIYNPKHVELLTNRYDHRNRELWDQGRKNQNSDCSWVQCKCCTTYGGWKSRHPGEYDHLSEYSAKQGTYKLFPNENVMALEIGVSVQYTGIVRSTSCTGMRGDDNLHQCNYCRSLLNGLTPQQ